MNIAKTLFFSFALVFITACGFKPMHASNGLGVSNISYSDIAVRTPNNEKIDFLLKQALRDRVGDNANAAYILQIKPRLSRDGIGIRGDDIASRYDLHLATYVELIDAKTGDVLWTDTVKTISTYSAPQDPYATISAGNNAAELAARAASERILIALARYQPKP